MEMTVGERIKQIRKVKGLTQQKLADMLGLKQNTIATYEMNKTTPSDRTIQDICEKFRINETWLRSGAGDMDAPVNEDEELAAFFAEVYQAPLDDACRRAIEVLQYLNRNHPDAIKALVEAADATYKEKKG